MVNFLNDGEIVGFWPLNEPSGVARFVNYTNTFGRMPSGISFDMHIQQSIDNSTVFIDYELSEWPGQATYFSSASGTTYRGLQLHGTYLSTAQSSRHSKSLVLGMGTSANQLETISKSIAQSGFTFGFWILPRSDGYQGYDEGGSINGTKQQAFGNAIMGRGDNDFSIWMGVSGSLAGGAQFSSTQFGGPHLLTGYVFVAGAGTANPGSDGRAELVEVPIEADRFTHLTCSYRFTDDTNNDVVIYKDGRLAASGTTSTDLTRTPDFVQSQFEDTSWVIGAVTDDATTAPSQRYPHTTGWNHLVSGAYLFRRPLNEGEVLDMHQQGGMQSELGFNREQIPINIDDPLLLAYYSIDQPGYSDASRHHRPLIGPSDEGDRGEFSATPGPFRRGGIYREDDDTALIATSGLTFDIAESAGGFTIFGRYFQAEGTSFISNLIMSMGSTDDVTPPVVSDATLGFHFSRETIDSNVRPFLRIYPIGDDGVVTTLSATDGTEGYQITGDFAMVYDDASLGCALYLNGELAESGVLSNSLQHHMTNLAGSGFPLMFFNGVLDQDPEAIDATASPDCGLFDIAVLGRPLLPNEIRGLSISGINTIPLMRTPHDPRLAGFWPCSDFDGDDLTVEDRASVWGFMPGHLSWSRTRPGWDIIEENDFGSQWYPVYSAFDVNRTLPPELDSFGNLGITSGIFTVMGGTAGSLKPLTVDNHSSIANYALRYKPVVANRDGACHNYNEWIFGFEVTPSGDIPLSEFQANGTEFNSVLFVWGEGTDSVVGYLTTLAHIEGQDPGSSGVSFVFDSNESSVGTQLGSGNLIYGVPNQIMMHTRWVDPYNIENDETDARLLINLYINGILAHTNSLLPGTALMWSDQIPGSTNDSYIMQFGGFVADPDANAPPVPNDTLYGLGENYLRNIFIMRGSFSSDDIQEFAASGIANTTNLIGFNDSGSLSTTQVTIADSDLAGYWRFSGQPSGETDLSFAGNDLVSLAKQAIEDGVFTPGANVEAAYNLRFLPGPLRNSDLAVQASGITYAGDNFTTNVIAPYVASGTAFQDPGAGFTIGLLWARRDDVFTANTAEVVLSYGVIPTDVDTLDILENAGWAIVVDEDENIKMVLSSAGNMNIDDNANAANSGQVTAGAFFTSAPFDTKYYEKFRAGGFAAPSINTFNSYIWAYDPDDEILRCYFNGALIDEQKAPSRLNLHGPVNNPVDPASRLVSFLIPQTDDVWNYDDARADFDSYITDVFYFQRAITEAEARYIAFNGIDNAVGTPTSGVVGGWIHGQDTGSGHIGGYARGVDVASGHIGGYMPGGLLASGIIGGYVSGVVFGTGTIGGWIRGLDDVSGIVAGYIRGVDVGSGSIAGYIAGQDVGSGHFGGLILAGQVASGLLGGYLQAADVGSGHIGGFMLGGLQGNFEFDGGYAVEVLAAQDFDAQLEIAKTVFSDFDAKVVIFQNEQPPLVDIIIPDATVEGLAPPFNQYFIGKASGQQGKTINSTRWTFGDFTPSQSVSQSGAGCYPIQHRYAASGFYIARFEAIDSDGLHASATRIINAASGIDPVIISLSGVPRAGNAELIVDFTTNIDILPPGVSLSAKLLSFDDGQATTTFNPTHVYTQPGTYRPIWCVRDSRGVTWCDSLEAGSDILE